MADDKTKTAPQDRQPINLHEHYEVHTWAMHYLVKALITLVILSVTAMAQSRADFTGTWDFVKVESSAGPRPESPPGTSTSTRRNETWTVRQNGRDLDIKISIKGANGSTDEENTCVIGGNQGRIGYTTQPDGTKDTITGSARWDGDALVIDKALELSKQHHVMHILRTLRLENGGSQMVADTLYWIDSSNDKKRTKWIFEKRQ